MKRVKQNLRSSTTLFFILFFTTCRNKVEKIKPIVSTITESVYASGTIKSKEQYQAFSTVIGTIKSVYLKEGDSVKIGTPILSIANELQQLNRENAGLSAQFADVASNQEKLRDANQLINLQNDKKKNDLLLLTRQQNLWQQNVGTKVQLEQRELAYESSKTAYESAILKRNDLKKQINFTASQSRINLAISKKQANDFTVKSQVNGTVYKIYKEKGELVNQQSPIALIGNNDVFVLEMQVDEYDIFKIKKGLQVLVTMDSYKGKLFQAKVSDVSPMMNEKSKTFLVEATFINPPKTLYPFVTFEANIILQIKEKALLIPRNLLLNDSTVMDKDNKKITVKTGLKDYQMVEILSGLTVNNELINPIK